MITNAIIFLLYYVINIIITPILILPDVSTESGIGSSIETASNYLANLNNILPLSTLLTILSIILSIEIGVATYKIIMWGIRIIRG